MSERKHWWPAVAAMVVLLLVLGGVAQAQAPVRAGGAPTAASAPDTPSAEQVPAAPAVPAATGPSMQQGPALPAASGPAAPAGQGGLSKFLLPVMMVALLLVFVLMGRKPRQEEKKRQEMLANIKKGDKITTIGGIIGTIVEVRDNEVVVKVDEATNARMRFVRSAIRIVGTADEAEKKEENK